MQIWVNYSRAILRLLIASITRLHRQIARLDCPSRELIRHNLRLARATPISHLNSASFAYIESVLVAHERWPTLIDDKLAKGVSAALPAPRSPFSGAVAFAKPELYESLEERIANN
jgi:hypothetical protein